MDEIKKLNEPEFKDLAAKLRFNQIFLAKDYYLTLAPYQLCTKSLFCAKNPENAQKGFCCTSKGLKNWLYFLDVLKHY